MKGFYSNSGLPYPNYKDVFRLLDDALVYSYYIPNLEFNTSIKSPLGERDEHPSFSVFWSFRKHKYIFKEHRYGWTGDCIDFVRYYFGYRNNRRACMRIMNDFGIQGFTIDDDIGCCGPTFTYEKLSKPKRAPSKFTLRIQIRNWQPYDLEFWGKWGITKEWLERGDIYPIKYYYFNSSVKKADKYAYAYVERKDKKITYKIYQPFGQRKWISNNDASVWELWNLLPETYDFLIITKSRKDALSIMATAGIPATSLQAEGTVPKTQVIDEVKQRFKKIFLFYDNDFDSEENWGQIYSNKLADSFDIPNIFIPDSYRSKDYTDFVVKYSALEAKNLLWNLIKREICLV